MVPDIKFNEMTSPSEKAISSAVAPVIPQTLEQLVSKVESNVKLVAQANPACVNGKMNVGMSDTLVFPSEEEQRAGFRVDNPGVLTKQFPDKYKLLVPKGGK